MPWATVYATLGSCVKVAPQLTAQIVKLKDKLEGEHQLPSKAEGSESMQQN